MASSPHRKLRLGLTFTLAAAAAGLSAVRWTAAQTTQPTTKPAATAPADPSPVRFNTNFEGGSLGRVEKLSPSTFKLHVEGQYDERGRNRQASWYYFRMENVGGRELTLTLTDLVGEYNDKWGAVPAGESILPVYSTDGGKTWPHVPAGKWDNEKKELLFTVKSDGGSVMVAHIPPYTPAHLDKLLADVADRPHVLDEVIGKTARGRDIHLLTVTDFDVPDDGKKSVWLQARQHAWEAGTSYVAEGAIRFLASDDPKAKELRRTTVFRFTPMVDVDGVAAGKVRFNANGYDVNRHWDEVDVRRPEHLRRMPEIWYTKKAIVNVATAARNGRPGHGIDLLVNMHNTETGEYLETHTQDPVDQASVRKLFELLTARTSFDPSIPLAVKNGPVGTTNALAKEYGIPVVLMEQRIAPGKKLGRRPTVEDRLAFGRDLANAMAEAVR